MTSQSSQIIYKKLVDKYINGLKFEHSKFTRYSSSLDKLSNHRADSTFPDNLLSPFQIPGNVSISNQNLYRDKEANIIVEQKNKILNARIEVYESSVADQRELVDDLLLSATIERTIQENIPALNNEQQKPTVDGIVEEIKIQWSSYLRTSTLSPTSNGRHRTDGTNTTQNQTSSQASQATSDISQLTSAVASLTVTVDKLVLLTTFNSPAFKSTPHTRSITLSK